MVMRERCLPEGWYPTDCGGVESQVALWERLLSSESAFPAASAVLSPHAGWSFSGSLAYRALRALGSDPDAVIVFGGHLGPASAPLLAYEDAFDTPCGALSAAAPLREALSREFAFAEDQRADNSVEVLLPLVKVLFPRASLLWVRLPPRLESYEVGAAAAALAERLGLRAACVGSADLTHYGPAYGLAAAGSGPAAERWASDNDAAFLSALERGDCAEALSLALGKMASCSAGAALACAGFADAAGPNERRVLGRASSLDAHRASSFVGYAAMSWTPSGA